MENAMESMNSPIKIGDSKEVSSLQMLSSSLDGEEYFELACEADDFGVHILGYSVAE
jgi:hypothetical protein